MRAFSCGVRRGPDGHDLPAKGGFDLPDESKANARFDLCRENTIYNIIVLKADLDAQFVDHDLEYHVDEVLKAYLTMALPGQPNSDVTLVTLVKGYSKTLGLTLVSAAAWLPPPPQEQKHSFVC